MTKSTTTAIPYVKDLLHCTETRQNAPLYSSVAATKAMAAKATVAESGTTNTAADMAAMERLQVIYYGVLSTKLYFFDDIWVLSFFLLSCFVFYAIQLVTNFKVFSKNSNFFPKKAKLWITNISIRSLIHLSLVVWHISFFYLK